jgi:tRNA A37 methylthiotransferase MiaB
MNKIAPAVTESSPTSAPKVGFVSLGCPKALTDSELILTQLSAEGYQTSKTFEGADLVIVNTCGFIDDAVKESLDTIAEALNVNGKVIVTGCLGAKEADGGGNLVREIHPSVLAVTGPHARSHGRSARAFAQTTRSLHRLDAQLIWRGRTQAHTQALRIFENQRRLQPPLHFLHHSVDARRFGVKTHWRRAQRSRGIV